MYRLDFRSLACLRIGLATTILIDIYQLLPFTEAHYSDAGVLSRASLWQFYEGSRQLWSVHMLGGSTEFIGALFGVQALVAIALLVGYRTTAATFLSWFLLLSLHSRNPVNGSGGDAMLRVLLFWSMFLSLGSVWSLDSRRHTPMDAKPCGARARPHALANLYSFAFILQICCIYWVTALAKSGPEWRSAGTAVEYTLRCNRYPTAVGLWLLDFPGLLKSLTFVIPVLEGLLPCLLFVPNRKGYLRMVVVVLFMAFHLGLAITIKVGIFPLVCFSVWLAFIPGTMWDRFARRADDSALIDAAPEDSVSIGAAPAGAAPADATPADEAPTQPAHRSRLKRAWPMREGLVVFVLAYVTVRCLQITYIKSGPEVIPSPLDLVGRGVGQTQSWQMFGQPTQYSSWLMAEAQLANGAKIDLLNPGRPLDWTAMPPIAGEYRNYRWTRYLTSLPRAQDKEHRLLFADYLCRHWNAAHAGGQQVRRVKLVVMEQLIRLDGGAAPVTQKTLIDWQCGVKPARGR